MLPDLSIHATREQFRTATDSLQRALTFTAWRLRDTTIAQPIDLPPCDTLDEAINAAKPSLMHKDRLFILHRDYGRDQAFQHGWTVRRKSTPRWVAGKPVHDLDLADHFCLAVESFEPVRPFDAFRDSATGLDLSIVEGRG
jgi:hypothetical protein